jgi:hypothetical protein
MFWKFIAEGSEQGVSEGSEGGIVGAKLKTLKRVTLLHEEAE